MGEYLRAPLMHGGDIKIDERLEQLGTGIFISNIHYLNWSDNLGGRITGIKDKGFLKALISFVKLFTELSISEDTVVADCRDFFPEKSDIVTA